MEMPDIEYENNISLINDEFLKLYANDTDVKDINIEYIYYDYKGKSSENIQLYYEYIINELKSPNSTYDMLVLDDKFLFGDLSTVESYLIGENFDIRNIHEHFVKISDYENKSYYMENINEYGDILKHGSLDDVLYGLPYEIDFDLLYYYHNNKNMNLEFSPPLNESSWQEAFPVSVHESPDNEDHTTSSFIPLNQALGDNDELLNFFIEYLRSMEKNEMEVSHYFDLLYNDFSPSDYDRIKAFIEKNSDINKVLSLSMNDAYQNFLSENTSEDSRIFKGKASFYTSMLKKNPAIEATLPPSNFSIFREKFLVINNNSPLPKETLVKVAFYLTSKKMQIFRAETFGTLPAVTLIDKNTPQDSEMTEFCFENQPLCQFMKDVNPIHIKDVFKLNPYSIPFMEVRVILPEVMRKFLLEGDADHLSHTFKNIVNTGLMKSRDKRISSFILHGSIAVFTIGCGIVMYLVHKYRKQPYLKVISPLFSNIIIFGFILKYISFTFCIQANSIIKCKSFYILEIISSNFILIPMYIITFRIYSIYTNRTNMNIGKKLNNKRLFIVIMVLSLISMTAFFLILSSNEIFISAYGTIDSDNHFPLCNHDNKYYYNIYFIYITVI
eukprot:jgi/Orpsp1_1/1174847/evm.model.c7180000051668.1